MVQTDLFGNKILVKLSPKINSVIIVIENEKYLFYPNFFSKSESDNYFQKLKNDILWKQ
jgi:hypothetical protein